MIQFAEDVLEVELFPWQKWVLIHALELLEDGQFRFRTVVLLVARQNGKSMLLLVLTLWRMFIDEAPLTIGTAQNLDISEELWQAALDVVKGTPQLDAEVPEGNVTMGNGKKSFSTVNGQRYKVSTASRKGGRGLSGDLVLLDELREHHNFDSWSAVTKTTMARARAQIWGASNAGDILSIVLRRIRALAHQALEWPDGNDDEAALGLQVEDDDGEGEGPDETLGLFEYSAPPACAVNDRAAWAQANPALGYSISERAIASAMRTDPDHVFRTEVLCQWVSAAAAGPFPAEDWAKTQDNTSRIAAGEDNLVCVDVSWDRSRAYIARVGRREDGHPHIEMTADRAGTDWVMGWLEERAEQIAGVIVQTNGAPASTIVDALDKSKTLTRIDWAGPNLGRASGIAFDHIRDHTVKHLQHPGLDLAAATAKVKQLGDSWVVDRRNSPHDASPLIAFIGALWGIETYKPEPARRSAYEDNDLMIL